MNLLKLSRARRADLEIISAHVQDAVIKVADLAFECLPASASS
jgi:hypothetical protein